MNSTFLIAALPRSRTAWLSAYLTYGQLTCFHEISAGITVEEFKKKLKETRMTSVVGSCETNATLVPSLALAVDRVICIHRPVDEVLKSLHDINIPVNEQMLYALDAGLERVASLKNAISIEFKDIDRRIQDIFDFIAPKAFSFPMERIQTFKNFNIQITSERWDDLFAIAESIINKKNVLAPTQFN